MKKDNREVYYGIDYEEKWYDLLPIYFILFIVPLIVYLKVIPLKGAAFEYWNGANTQYDFFSYYKMVWLLIATSIAAVILIYKLYKERFRCVKTYFYIPIAIYFICIVVATIFSEHRDIALGGFTDRYEGMYILIAYLILMIFTMNLIKSEKSIKIIIIGLLFSASIISVIGIFQYLGYDLYQSNFGKSLILPSMYDQFKSSLQFMNEPHSMYVTFYHKDYTGSYMAMLFPLAFTLFFLTSKKSIKALFGVFTILTFAVWFGNGSRAGMVGGVTGVFLLMFMIRKYIKRNLKHFLGGLILVIAIVLGLNITSHGRLFNQASKIFVDVKGLFQDNKLDEAKTKDLLLKDLKVNGKDISIITKTETLNVELNNDKTFKFKDENNKDINIVINNANIALKDSKYESYSIKIAKYNDMPVLQCTKGDFILNFAILNDEFKLLDGKYKTVEIKSIDKIGFEGKESIASSRGFIWSRTFPLILKKPILGYGPDTFAIYFPQNDFMGKYNFYDGRMWELVDKPHNLYIQTAFSTGIPSLIAFLSLMLMYLISSVKIYFSNEYKDFSSIAGVGIFVAIMGYLVTGILNDSVVSVAPVFWVLLGLGISINLKLKKV